MPGLSERLDCKAQEHLAYGCTVVIAMQLNERHLMQQAAVIDAGGVSEGAAALA